MIVPVSKHDQRGWLRPSVATTDCDLDVVLAVKQAYALGALG
jgi:hypothetical protein